jgi:ABC-2 type transport system ATP-binding protein
MTAPNPRPAEAAPPVIVVRGLSHRYGDREALRDVHLEIRTGEIFGLLGPNGGGKTTLFKVLATLVAPQAGIVTIFGADVARRPLATRRRLGVVFQHPGLDAKLTVDENLRCHAALYGLGGAALRARRDVLLARLGLADRLHERVETLSGGLARRVELAKGLLHAPELLLLDEPSSGLDPGARRDFIDHLVHLREHQGLTAVLTTHAMEEAERCDRVGFVHRGRLVAVGTPDELKARIGGDVVIVHASNPERMRMRISQRFGCEVRVVDGVLRIELPRGHEFVREVVEAFPRDISAVAVGKPTLEDVFVHVTGDRFWTEGAPVEIA